MDRKPKIKTGAARIIWICCLTLFFTSVATIAVFYSFFGDELIEDAVRRVVERTVGYRVFLTGIRLESPTRVSVEGMDLVVGSTVFSSGPATLEFRLGLNPAISIRKVSVRNPSVSLDISQGGAGGADKLIRTLMKMDIVITDGDLVVTDKAVRSRLYGVDMSYEHGFTGATLTIEGSARTEGEVQIRGPILNGPFSGRLHVSGAYPDVTARGVIAARGSGYFIDDYLFTWDQVNAHVKLDREAIEATDVSMTGLSVISSIRKLRLDSIAATGEMKNETDGPFALSDVELSAPRVGEVSLDLLVEKSGIWKVTASSDALRLSGENMKRLGRFVPEAFAGWGATGNVRGTLTMASTEDGSITGDLDGNLIDAGFSSPDSLFLGDGISGTVKLQFRDDIKRGFLFDSEMDVHGFGLLLSDLFLNFEKKRISVRASGRVPSDEAVRDLECEISIPAILSARISGDLDFRASGAVGDLTYRLTAPNMGEAFTLLFRDFFRNRIAWLYTGTVAGTLDSRGSATGNMSAPRVSGNVTVTGGLIDLPDIDSRVEGLSASLPFSLDFSGGSRRDPNRRFSPGEFGAIAFSHAVVGGVDVNGITMSPAIAENSIAFRDDIVLSFSGGKVTVSKFSAGNVLSEDRTLECSLSVEGVDIARLFPKEKLINLKGELSGGLPDIRIAEKKLFTSGYLTAKIFNGTIRIDTIWGQDIFDAGRRLGCNVLFSGIDLGALTQTIDVGRVTGIAEGSISDFVFSYGGPERFVFDISTVSKRGVRNRVSVDFVDKLTILGSGSTLLSGVLKGGIGRFIREYNYSKIGIHLELKDDYFTLRGTIHEGDKEFFIKRSGLTGINVINQNPNNRIRFNDMVQRLERINVNDTEDIRVETK